MNLSEHLTLEEMCHSDTAIANKIDNTPGPEELANMERFAREIFEPIRALIAGPVHLTSGFRCHALELVVSGTLNSQHLHGQAMDCHVDGLAPRDLFDTIHLHKGTIPYDQLLLESNRAGSVWVHVSGGVDKPRQMAMIGKETTPGHFDWEHIA